jgi:hypothetical protein
MSEPGSPSQPDEALLDLLIKQVTEGLSPAEQRELDVLDTDAASGYLRDFEQAAAAIALAGSANANAMPEPLRQRLDESARTFFAPAAVPQSATPSARAVSGFAANGWWAAAACLVLAVFGWVRSPSPAPPAVSIAPPAVIAPPGPMVNATPPPLAIPTDERAALLAKPTSLKIKLEATKDPGAAGASGDVVWDPATQRGYLHFVGLAPNDPRIHQYQLWIFDGARDQRYPVDGGVFDIPANATDVVVPIHAALDVHKAAAFAVTVERPGGVVVSAREHIVVLGAAG